MQEDPQIYILKVVFYEIDKRLDQLLSHYSLFRPQKTFESFEKHSILKQRWEREERLETERLNARITTQYRNSSNDLHYTRGLNFEAMELPFNTPEEEYGKLSRTKINAAVAVRLTCVPKPGWMWWCRLSLSLSSSAFRKQLAVMRDSGRESSVGGCSRFGRLSRKRWRSEIAGRKSVPVSSFVSTEFFREWVTEVSRVYVAFFQA